MRKVIYRFFWVNEVKDYLPVSKDFIDGLVKRMRFYDSRYELKIDDKGDLIFYNLVEK